MRNSHDPNSYFLQRVMRMFVKPLFNKPGGEAREMLRDSLNVLVARGIVSESLRWASLILMSLGTALVVAPSFALGVCLLSNVAHPPMHKGVEVGGVLALVFGLSAVHLGSRLRQDNSLPSGLILTLVSIFFLGIVLQTPASIAKVGIALGALSLATGLFLMAHKQYGDVAVERSREYSAAINRRCEEIRVREL